MGHCVMKATPQSVPRLRPQIKSYEQLNPPVTGRCPGCSHRKSRPCSHPTTVGFRDPHLPRGISAALGTPSARGITAGIGSANFSLRRLRSPWELHSQSHPRKLCSFHTHGPAGVLPVGATSAVSAQGQCARSLPSAQPRRLPGSVPCVPESLKWP